MMYTRNGDDGTTGLFGTTKRMQKSSCLIDTLGDVDELVSLLGVCRSHCNIKKAKDITSAILEIQECLFIVQAELAGASKSIKQKQINELESAIKSFEDKTNIPKNFIIPGSTKISSLLDFARSLSRRVERKVVAIKEIQNISPHTLVYLNRLSSILYVLARYEAFRGGKREMSPSYAK